ncbi:MAG: sulfatase-like hydrolase/transferase [Chitinophagaceae bacterium]
MLLSCFTKAQSKERLQAQKKPNVILIYTDDQGSLDLNIYGAKDLYTPNIDALAKKSVRFTQFYAAAPVCSPSRASLMTGRYPQRAELATNASSHKGGKIEMPGSQVTMAEMFKSAGYATCHIGKWHIGYSPSTMPNQQGFDYSFGHMGGCIDNYSHYFYWQGPNRHDLWRNGEEIWEDGKFFPDLMVNEVNRFLEKSTDKPFYLYWALNIPHYPLQGQEKWRKYYKDLPSPRKEYAALISTMDEKIGAVLQKLKILGLEENTIVIFQSDHGHSEEERSFGSGGYAGPYRGSKFSLLEGGIRVPAMISWPGNLPLNEVRGQLAVNVDWFPTLAELCKVPLPDRKIDGKSLVKVINSSNAPSPHDSFVWQSGGGKDPQWAVRQGEWKLLHNPIGNKLSDADSGQKLYLFNLKNDVEEKKNELQQHPEIVDALTRKYQQWLEEVPRQ